MKIDSSKSREIYELATDPTKKITNCDIAKQYGITEGAVRHHIAKWERKLHEISRTNEKAAQAIATHAVNVTEEAANILDAVKASILEAKECGVSPEKLSGLYNNWIRSLELCGELLGKLNPPGQVNVGVQVQVNQQFNEFMKVILSEVNDNDRQRIIARLKPAAIY